MCWVGGIGAQFSGAQARLRARARTPVEAVVDGDGDGEQGAVQRQLPPQRLPPAAARGGEQQDGRAGDGAGSGKTRPPK